jgi:(p)ppGpp synthase/HD superfamily hydrolase
LHVERVAKILIDYGVNDENVLAATYVHHALIIDAQNEPIILKELGTEVLEIVKEFKKLSTGSISSIDPTNINEKYIIQAYINIASNSKTLLIRLADKVDNIRSVYALPRTKAQKVALRAFIHLCPNM